MYPTEAVGKVVQFRISFFSLCEEVLCCLPALLAMTEKWVGVGTKELRVPTA